jgi:dephospho-CoA kinase
VYLVGLTGGIGSGKSTVAARLRDLGCEVIDADQVAREVVAIGEPALAELVERFGEGILRADGELDRPALASIVFADPEARADLDRITHPRVAARIAERVAVLGAAHGASADQLVVVDHPLLFETDQAGRFDAVVAVVAAEEVRLARLLGQREMLEDDVRARMATQIDDLTRRALATYVVENDGSRDELLAEVEQLHGALRGAAARARPTGR